MDENLLANGNSEVISQSNLVNSSKLKFYFVNPSSSDTEFETPPTTLITSFLFQCNLFKLVQHNDYQAAGICLACKRKGVTRYVRGKTTSNYHNHMKVNDNKYSFWILNLYFNNFRIFHSLLSMIACAHERI